MGLLWQSTLLSVSPNVILTPLDGSQFFPLDLRRLLNGLRHMTLALDSPDLRHMRVSVDQGLVVLQLRALASTLDPAAIRSISTPETNIAIVRAREDVFVIGGEFSRENTVEREKSALKKFRMQ